MQVTRRKLKSNSDLGRQTTNMAAEPSVKVARPSALTIQVERTNYGKNNAICLQPWCGQCCWPFEDNGFKDECIFLRYLPVQTITWWN
ncbi:hypothetical protein J6590_085045 [Homalodisca vitripennis]|nr:hypothetical protein J6590_085045 [Homalodisca vitripennis]